MISGATHPNAAPMGMDHNRGARAFLTVWNRLKSGCRALPKHTHIFHEPNWLRILKLLAKLYILGFKVRRLRAEQRILLLQQNDLLREQRNLRRQQINHVLGQPGRAGDAKNLFRGIERTQDAKVKS